MSFDMPPEEFREQGHGMVDWMADYLRDIREHNEIDALRIWFRDWLPGVLEDCHR